jgi:dTDP-4-dehydrorhamnose reductase
MQPSLNTNSLIGYSGFVGSVLRKQAVFEVLFRSSNISEIDGLAFDRIVCCAAPAQKWIANREPEADLHNIECLMEHLGTVQCNTFILISTVDVFKNSASAHENTPVEEAGLHPYGLHRRLLEKFVEDRFPNHLIVRLPGLVGPGLRKNVIFDFLNNNNLHVIDSRGIFQFYPMVNLWYDIQIALQFGLKLVHLTSEPVSVADIAETCFGKIFHQSLPNPPAVYDFQSNYASLFGGHGRYQYNRRETIQAVRAYAQSEPVTLKAESGTI